MGLPPVSDFSLQGLQGTSTYIKDLLSFAAKFGRERWPAALRSGSRFEGLDEKGVDGTPNFPTKIIPARILYFKIPGNSLCM